MSFGIKENPQSSGRNEKPDSPFPEPHHTKHQPSKGGAEPHYVKKSEHVGRGHEDSMNRMPHPFGADNPNDETGRGTSNNPKNASIFE